MEDELTAFIHRLRLDAQGNEQMSAATLARFPKDFGLFLDHGADINQKFNYRTMLSELNLLPLSKFSHLLSLEDAIYYPR